MWPCGGKGAKASVASEAATQHRCDPGIRSHWTHNRWFWRVELVCCVLGVLPFLVLASVSLDDGVAPLILQLLQCALCGSKAIEQAKSGSTATAAGSTSAGGSTNSVSPGKSKKEDKTDSKASADVKKKEGNYEAVLLLYYLVSSDIPNRSLTSWLTDVCCFSVILKGHYSRWMATYCGHSNAPAEYALKEEVVILWHALPLCQKYHLKRFWLVIQFIYF